MYDDEMNEIAADNQLVKNHRNELEEELRVTDILIYMIRWTYSVQKICVRGEGSESSRYLYKLKFLNY